MNETKDFIASTFDIDLDENIDDYKNRYENTFDAIETVRPALISLFNSTDFEDAIRNAVSFGGDTDTITTICASISEAFYKEIPKEIKNKAKGYLPKEFLNLLNLFNSYIEKQKA